MDQRKRIPLTAAMMLASATPEIPIFKTAAWQIKQATPPKHPSKNRAKAKAARKQNRSRK